jgi:hypothetical protein
MPTLTVELENTRERQTPPPKLGETTPMNKYAELGWNGKKNNAAPD